MVSSTVSVLLVALLPYVKNRYTKNYKDMQRYYPRSSLDKMFEELSECMSDARSEYVRIDVTHNVRYKHDMVGAALEAKYFAVLYSLSFCGFLADRLKTHTRNLWSLL